MKQTAVEWFCNEMENLRVKAEITNMNGYDFIIAKVKLFEQAKQMEKEQIVKANRDGVDMVVYKKVFILGEQYYNETFKSE